MKTKKKITKPAKPQKPAPVSTFGSVSKAGAMYLRINVGTASDPGTGLTYELTINAGTNLPLVTCNKTKKVFSFTWQELINAAKAAGVSRG